MKAPLLLSLLAAALVQVSPAALALNGTCQFRAKGISMNFGALDPSSGSNASAVLAFSSLNADEVGDCRDLTMTIDGDGGPRLLTHASGASIPYTFVGLPIQASAPGNNRYIPFTFSGLILWNSYANAPAGNYTDTVMISVTP